MGIDPSQAFLEIIYVLDRHLANGRQPALTMRLELWP
jgi:hypothetical protein